MSVQIIVNANDNAAQRATVRKILEVIYGEGFFSAPTVTSSVQNELPLTALAAQIPPPLNGVVAPVDNPAAGGLAEPEGNFAATSGEWPKQVGNFQVDCEGTPYSKDIHSDPAQVTTKGVWRAKRGINKDAAAKRAAELRALVGGPGVTTGTTPAVQGVHNPNHGVLTPPPAAPAPTLAPMLPPPLPAPTPAPAPQPLPAYVALMESLGAYMKSPANPAGIMEDADVSGVLAQMNLSQLTDIQYSEALLQTFAAKFNDAYGAKYHRLASGG